MDELTLVRGMLLRSGRAIDASASTTVAVLQWAEPHRGWLIDRPPAKAGKALRWKPLLASAGAASPADAPRPLAISLAESLAERLAFGAFDTALLTILVAVDRLPRLAGFAAVLARHGFDLASLIGELAGAEPHEADRLVRNSAVLRLELASFRVNRLGGSEVDLNWTLDRLLDRAPPTGEEMIDLLAGKRQPPSLALADFGPSKEIDFLVGLLRGALDGQVAGANVLIHGPAGTGKTELARTLAGAAGATLRAVGETDDDGDEPSRWERVQSLQLAQRLLGGRDRTVLLFDEMEDLIGDAEPAHGSDRISRRQGSKVFINRMLETNPVPVIWTSNAIDNVDPAMLRRMSFVLHLDLPSRNAAARMLARVAAEEGVTPGLALDRLLDLAPETATVLRIAARAGKLAGAGDGGALPAASLVRALRGGVLPPPREDLLDLDLFESERPIAGLFDRIAAGGAADVSLLLTGPPGTGKTALAHHLARALDRPLVVKRASDLLSKWVGGTEAAIAGAFAEARQRDGVLLFDEVDSLLFDRSTATTSWEVGQVNELLTWLDHHPLPVVAATNHGHRLDPAALRRFVFKLDLRALHGERADRAFAHFFAKAPPPGLREVTGLTPGDFAVVARQLRHGGPADAGAIVALLQAEAAAKPERGVRIGF